MRSTASPEIYLASNAEAHANRSICTRYPDGMADAAGVDSAADARDLERRIWLRIWLANLVGVIPINIYFTIVAGQFEKKIELHWSYGFVAVAVYMPAYIYSRWRAKQMFRPIGTWVSEGRAPDERERHLTIDHPRRLAVMSAWCWAWALLCSLVIGQTVFVSLGFLNASIVATVVLSTLIACALTY